MLEFKEEQELNLQINNLKSKTKIISLIRLTLFILILIFIICLISLKEYLLYSILLGSSILILSIVLLSTNKYYKDLEFAKTLNLIYKRHYFRRDLSFKLLDSDPNELDKEDYKLYDLDIIGGKSLYRYLCSAKTKDGKLKLFNALKNGYSYTKEETNLIYKMSNHEDTLKIEAKLQSLNNLDKSFSYEEFKSVLEEDIKLDKKSILSPILTLLFYTLLIIGIFNTNILPFAIIPFILNLIISRFFIKYKALNINASKYKPYAKSYLDISKYLLKLDFNDSYYNKIKEEIADDLKSLKSLNKVYTLLNIRNNIILQMLLNGLLSYDFIIELYLNKVLKNTNKIDNIFNNITNIEMYISFANLGINNKITIAKESNHLNFKGLVHPLVKNFIPQDFNLDKGIILTGSNMSGKTTFMRMLGINQILFNACGVACADYFESSKLEVLTSLRANDMLSEGISTFYAEIKRMQKITSSIKVKKCLILIDEIFKGTNEFDALYAASEVVKKLNEYNQLFIISTHMISLTKIDNIINYHFEEYYENDLIKFDYKIKEGPSTSTNARYLLKISKVIEE